MIKNMQIEVDLDGTLKTTFSHQPVNFKISQSHNSSVAEESSKISVSPMIEYSQPKFSN